MKRPHFLKCIYKDQNEKELIVNRGNLVVYHKKYNKSYFYPVSKSYFMDILDKKKFKNLVLKGDLRLNNKFIELKYNSEKKGEIIFFFVLKLFIHSIVSGSLSIKVLTLHSVSWFGVKNKTFFPLI